MACGGKALTEADLLPFCYDQESAEAQMNLSVLKQADPYAKEIVDKSADVILYTFNEGKDDWENTNTRGAFFVYSRTAEPYRGVFINSQSNTNSLVEPILAGTKLQNKSPFMLFRNERDTLGFWFTESTDCDRISDLITEFVGSLTITSTAQQSKTDTNAVDLEPSTEKLKQIDTLLSFPPTCLKYRPAFVLLNAKSSYTNFIAPRIPSMINAFPNLPAFQMKNEILNAIW